MADLLPLPGKILEKLVHQQLSHFLETGSILADAQHGFRKNHSTIHSTAQLTNFVNKKMDSSVTTAALFIDFKKAFDCVQHPMLVEKFRQVGLCETLVEWVISYLSDRQQRVYANDTYLDFQNITQSVPQASVLRPLFYIVYANDLVKTVKRCKIAM